MNIKISSQALNWFKEEMGLKKGDYLKFHARYGGCSTVQQGFSLGMSIQEPQTEMAASIEKDGICFFIDEEDLWFFNGHDLAVDYNEKREEIEFTFLN
ncbi:MULTISPECIES: HesB/YadR/YfhF family protein [Neobacillus]|uniref:HesB/YadR/YfhF family protein n=1 Tax=Neobacillus sedimentimangrovi TaxID=2699460 RepID=A0ABS8QHB8_9BACI|nr:HesB/YadR/YfhF family protein [Neobacillus sedimentimangrovi]AIM15714.1 hypothetical protein HW35_04835 [Bacillus sp. X1(2014)]MCD4838659.1 HesB/YadR/YfhF family protein [Neobacillus sedimentimangrovi]